MLINKDKLYHLLAGFLIFFAGYILYNATIGIILTFIAATLKEGYDEAHPDNHTVDWLDFVTTLAGAFIGYCLLVLI